MATKEWRFMNNLRWKSFQVIKITRWQRTSEDSFVHSSTICYCILYPRESSWNFQTVEQFMKLKFRSMVHYSWRWKKEKNFHHYSPFSLLLPILSERTFSLFSWDIMNWIKQNNSFSFAIATENCSQLMQKKKNSVRIHPCFQSGYTMEHGFMQIRRNCNEWKRCETAICMDNEQTN